MPPNFKNSGHNFRGRSRISINQDNNRQIVKKSLDAGCKFFIYMESLGRKHRSAFVRRKEIKHTQHFTEKPSGITPQVNNYSSCAFIAGKIFAGKIAQNPK